MRTGPGPTGDLSNNRPAAILRELAEGGRNWSILLAFGFLIWRLIESDEATLFSLRGIGLLFAGEAVFVIGTVIGNALLAAIMAIVCMPLGMKGEVRAVQNTLNGALAAYGVFLLIASWYYSKLAFYVFYG